MNVSSTKLPPDAVFARWEEVARRWALGAGQRSALLGGPASALPADIRSPEAELAERRMRLLVELDGTLRNVFGDDERLRAWLRARNRRLGGDSPLEVMTRSSAWTRWLTDHMGLTT